MSVFPAKQESRTANGFSWPLRLAAFAITITVLAFDTAAVTLRPEMVAAFTQRYGDAARERLLDWERVMVAALPGAAQSKNVAVNNFFNLIPWVSDMEHWNSVDYWATPLEVLGTNGADCEDFAIAKYFTLAQLDVPRGKLLITYVRATKLNQAHMVLAYYPTPDADPYILDNLDGEIRRGSERRDLVPVYSFNGDGLWSAVSRGLGKRVGSPARIAQWRAVVERMRMDASPGLAAGV